MQPALLSPATHVISPGQESITAIPLDRLCESITDFPRSTRSFSSPLSPPPQFHGRVPVDAQVHLDDSEQVADDTNCDRRHARNGSDFGARDAWTGHVLANTPVGARPTQVRPQKPPILCQRNRVVDMDGISGLIATFSQLIDCHLCVAGIIMVRRQQLSASHRASHTCMTRR